MPASDAPLLEGPSCPTTMPGRTITSGRPSSEHRAVTRSSPATFERTWTLPCSSRPKGLSSVTTACGSDMSQETVVPVWTKRPAPTSAAARDDRPRRRRSGGRAPKAGSRASAGPSGRRVPAAGGEGQGPAHAQSQRAAQPALASCLKAAWEGSPRKLWDIPIGLPTARTASASPAPRPRTASSASRPGHAGRPSGLAGRGDGATAAASGHARHRRARRPAAPRPR